jgi:hypothetical protein
MYAPCCIQIRYWKEDELKSEKNSNKRMEIVNVDVVSISSGVKV